MGHLTRIANSIVHNSDKGPNGVQTQQLISGLSQSHNYIRHTCVCAVRVCHVCQSYCVFMTCSNINES